MAEVAAKKPSKFVQGCKQMWAKTTKYFKDVRAELKKVAWPTPKQVRNNTIIVLICIAIVGVIIWALDIVFAYGLDFFINSFK